MGFHVYRFLLIDVGPSDSLALSSAARMCCRLTSIPCYSCDSPTPVTSSSGGSRPRATGVKPYRPHTAPGGIICCLDNMGKEWLDNGSVQPASIHSD